MRYLPDQEPSTSRCRKEGRKIRGRRLCGPTPCRYPTTRSRRWLRQNRPEPDGSLLLFRNPNRLDHHPLHFFDAHQGLQDNRKLHRAELQEVRHLYERFTKQPNGQGTRSGDGSKLTVSRINGADTTTDSASLSFKIGRAHV